MDDAAIAVLTAPPPQPWPDDQSAIEWRIVCEGLGIPEHSCSSFIQQWRHACEEYQYYLGTLLAKKSRLDDITVEQRRLETKLKLFDNTLHTRLATDVGYLVDKPADSRLIAHDRLCLTRRTAFLDGAANMLYHNMNIDYTHANATKQELAKAREYFLDMHQTLFPDNAKLMPWDVVDSVVPRERITTSRSRRPWSFSPVPPEVRLQHLADHDANIALD